MASPHEIINPDSLAAPRGFSHAVAASGGRTIYLGGQAGHRQDGSLAGADVVTQFDQAAANVVAALASADARPEHLVSLLIYCTDAASYRNSLPALGAAYRSHFGSHYPAIAFMEVAALFDPDAKVELVGVAVVHE